MTADLWGRRTAPFPFERAAALLVVGALAASGLARAQEAPPTAAAPAVATPATADGPRQLSLDDALALAEQTSEGVRIAAAEVRRTEAQVKQARSGWLPQLDGTAGYTRTLHSEFQDINFDFGGGSNFSSLPFGQANTYRLGLTLNQSVFNGGRVTAETQAARAGLSSAHTGLASSRADLELQVTQAYFDALLLDRLVSITEQTYEQEDRAYELTKLANRVGNQSEFELLRAQVARDNTQPALVQRRANRDLAYARLAQLLHLPPNEPLALTTGFAHFETWESRGPVPAAATRAAWLEKLTDERAPVRQAQAAWDAQEALARVAHAARLPDIGVSSDYGRVAYPVGGLPAWGDTRTNWTVGVGLRVPVLTGGRLAAQEAAARAAADEAKERLAQVRQAAWLDARDALDQLAAAQAVWAATSGNIAQAQRAYEIAELRYREGLSTQLELNDTRLQLTLAQGNAALAARNLQVARARVALLPDLPLGAGASALASTSTGGASPTQTAPTTTNVGILTSTGGTQP